MLLYSNKACRDVEESIQTLLKRGQGMTRVLIQVTQLQALLNTVSAWLARATLYDYVAKSSRPPTKS